LPHSVRVNNEDTVCELSQSNECPKSDVIFLAEHGPAQEPTHWTVGCRTCKHITIIWSPKYVALAKQGKLDREMNRLMDPRFQGMTPNYWGAKK